jgi:RimJ/RimL family protein N-acetyltransferase
VFLRTHESNVGSRKVAERNGFKVEGIIRKDYKTTKGEIVDLLYYGKIAGD